MNTATAAKNLRIALRLVALTAAGSIIALAAPQWDTAMEFPSTYHDNGPTAHAQTAASTLITEHACWTGEAPKGVTPAHAVVTANGHTTYTDAKVGFGIWLDGKPGTLHAFCR